MGGETVWCNPPYSDIEPWVAKAWDEHPATGGIVMLLPANRTEQGWWQRLVEPFRDQPGSPLTVTFLRGRMRFLRPGQSAIGPNERPPFGCCLLVWHPPIRPTRQLMIGATP
ncbi:MAG: DNA N-6-adenine-methyltransferase [Jatrophihabitans sp.]|uniref:DNA N-6-adenine-methyltransferase n=1 Tax=Jatrophihabitans sp. TaxID=1932789 RepID=UPI003F80F606